MKRFPILLAIAVALVGAPSTGYSEMTCGQEGLACDDSSERCCEHVVAMFSNDTSAAPAYVEGQCVPKEQKCAEFSCGNAQCNPGFFGTPTVCCINLPNDGAARQYSCAYSELSCPGNSQKLTIRDTQPTRTLRRG